MFELEKAFDDFIHRDFNENVNNATFDLVKNAYREGWIASEKASRQIYLSKKIPETRDFLHESAKNAEIGFVPTMGGLHTGHASLIERARKENNFVAVSIFVNPTQFGENEDFSAYPRDLERDIDICAEAGADLIFAPDAAEMYPEGFQSAVDAGEVSQGLCGGSRPGHFRGVCTVVAKLFNIISPTRAYFGQKDFQQLAVIKQMVKDLEFNIEIVPCEIVREADGLAMSSRNSYLSPGERTAATVLYRALKHAEERVKNGEQEVNVLKKDIINFIGTEPLAKIDYAEFVDERVKPVEKAVKGTVLALAVFVGKTRLIDNMIIP